MLYKNAISAAVLASVLGLSSCGDDSSSSSNRSSDNSDNGTTNQPVSLGFKAQSGDLEANCENILGGFGLEQTDSIGIRDLRFYISNIQFFDAEGTALEVEFDSNDFQYNSEQGFVALVDLTSNTSGSCVAAEGEGTERINSAITGSLADSEAIVTSVSFDIGLPQPVMKDVIATNTEADAPSPLNEMFWSWAAGYRHFVFNFEVMNTAGTYGDGFLHIGSRGCGSEGQLALESKEQCDFINTPSVTLDGFNPANNTVVVDIAQVLNNLSFVQAVEESEETLPGVSCHSSPMQPDCLAIFTNFGVNLETGAADAASNSVFGME